MEKELREWVWPTGFLFFIVVLGNIGYHEVAKATPVSAPPFLALSVTYLVSFLLCAAVYVVTGPSLRQDLSALN